MQNSKRIIGIDIPNIECLISSSCHQNIHLFSLSAWKIIIIDFNIIFNVELLIVVDYSFISYQL